MNSNSIRIALVLLAVSFAMWQHEAAQAASSRACDAFARDYARNASRQGQVVRRGVFGGLLGLGVGAATGGAAAGAAIGGAVGGASGGMARQRTADKIYWAAYRDCMAGRVQLR